MSVAYVSDVDATGSTTPITIGSTAVGATANPVIVVMVSLFTTGGETVTGVTWNGASSGTPVNVKSLVNPTGPGYLSIWAIPAPVGTGTITVTLSANAEYSANAILFSGADQTTPCPAADAGSVSNDDVSTTLSVTPANLTANDAAVGCGHNVNGGDGATLNQTVTLSNNAGFENSSFGYHLGTGAISVSWAPGNQSHDAVVAARIAAASTSASPFAGTIDAQTVPDGKRSPSDLRTFARQSIQTQNAEVLWAQSVM